MPKLKLEKKSLFVVLDLKKKNKKLDMQLKKLKLHSFLLNCNHLFIPNKFIMLNMNVKCVTEHLLFI